MSQSPQMSDSAANNDRPGSSPLPGCIILVVTLFVFGGLATLYIVRGLKMNAEIDKFTEPQAMEVATPEVTQSQIEVVDAKLQALKEAASGNRMERFAFTAEDINALLASKKILADFEGRARVEGISEKGMEVLMSQELRSLKWWEPRFLNGTFYLNPHVQGVYVVFSVKDVVVPGKEVNPGFVEGFAAQDFFRLDTRNEDMSPTLKKIGKVYIEGDKIIVETRVDTEKVGDQ